MAEIKNILEENGVEVSPEQLKKLENMANIKEGQTLSPEQEGLIVGGAVPEWMAKAAKVIQENKGKIAGGIGALALVGLGTAAYMNKDKIKDKVSGKTTASDESSDDSWVKILGGNENPAESVSVDK